MSLQENITKHYSNRHVFQQMPAWLTLTAAPKYSNVFLESIPACEVFIGTLWL